MKILLITYQFGGSASGIMSYRVASELVRQRHDVYVVTEHNHISSEQWDGNKCLELRHMFSKRSLYYRIYWHLSSKYRSTGIDYIWCLRAFYKSFCFAKSWKPDWIYCRSSPIHANIIGLFFSKRGYKVLQHFADPFPAPNLTDMRARCYLKQIVIPIFKVSSVVSMGTSEMLEYELNEIGMNLSNKFFISPDPSPYDKIHYFRKKISHQGKVFRLTVLGNISDNRRNPVPLFMALKELNDNGVQCNLYVCDDCRIELDAEFEPIVHFIGRHADVASQLQESDIVVDLDGEDAIPVFMSSKLKDYLCSNVPILSITTYNSPSGRLLRNLKTVKCISNKTDEILSAIEYLFYNNFTVDDFQERNVVLQKFTPYSIANHIIHRCKSFLRGND